MCGNLVRKSYGGFLPRKSYGGNFCSINRGGVIFQTRESNNIAQLRNNLVILLNCAIILLLRNNVARCRNIAKQQSI